jgi:K(+)-stimulated pyrophosphate-energized sodium pump
VKIKIGGYTDNTGNANFKLKLSGDRAKAVVDALTGLGIAGDRLESECYGSKHPIADNATPEGRAKNRRIAVSVRAK